MRPIIAFLGYDPRGDKTQNQKMSHWWLFCADSGPEHRPPLPLAFEGKP